MNRQVRRVAGVVGLFGVLLSALATAVAPTSAARTVGFGRAARAAVDRRARVHAGVSRAARLTAGADHATSAALAASLRPAAAPVTAPAAPAPVVAAASVAPAASIPAPTPTPPAVQFYVDPADQASVEVKALMASGQTSEATELEQISGQPQAIWLTNDASATSVPSIMAGAAQQGTVPIFVLYNLPDRDCGGDSSGGASDPSAYESYVNTVVAGLGQSRAYLIVEPDALSEFSCLPSSEQQSYDQLIGYAAQQLDRDANASVYVDAGNPTWKPAATEAAALQSALGSTRAGFALNTSNFVSTATDIAYGTAISQATGGRHFVIDTSRNGATVAGGGWCNPPGAALGANPTTNTGNSLVDALLWIKSPGESDGTCNGGPTPGQLWLSYALGLIANR